MIRSLIGRHDPGSSAAGGILNQRRRQLEFAEGLQRFGLALKQTSRLIDDLFVGFGPLIAYAFHGKVVTGPTAELRWEQFFAHGAFNEIKELLTAQFLQGLERVHLGRGKGRYIAHIGLWIVR